MRHLLSHRVRPIVVVLFLVLAPALVGLAIGQWRAPERLSSDIALEHQTATHVETRDGATAFEKVEWARAAGAASAVSDLPAAVEGGLATAAIDGRLVEAQTRGTRSYRLSQEAVGSKVTRPSGGSGESGGFGSAGGGGGAGAWGGVSGTASNPSRSNSASSTRAASSSRSSGGSGGGGSSQGSAAAAEGRGLASGLLPGRAEGRGALSASPASTPEPLSLFLIGTGLAGVYGMRRYL